MLALRRGARRLDMDARRASGHDSWRTGRRDDVAVVPADAKSIAINPAWRNPAFAFPRARALRTSCRVS